MTPPASLVTRAAAGAASAAFGAVAVLRSRKPLHPRGLVVPAVVERTGRSVLSGPTGSPWLDEPGRDDGVARLSRSAGLPDGWPDVWGLALRVPAGDGVADLLLSTAWSAPGGRHVLTLRRGLQAPLSTIVPYRSPAGGLLLVGVPGPAVELPTDRTALAQRLAREPLALTLAVATPRGPWRPFGTLTIGGAPEGTGDGTDGGDLSFDPVLNPLPGLALPDPVASVRARAYAGARAGRHADPATLDRLPARR